MNPNGLGVDYGYGSAEFRAFTQLQGQVIAATVQYGAPEEQVATAKRQLPQYCAGAVR